MPHQFIDSCYLLPLPHLLTVIQSIKMSTETAFYRRNFVISSVCPGKRTSAGQNSAFVMLHLLFDSFSLIISE